MTVTNTGMLAYRSDNITRSAQTRAVLRDQEPPTFDRDRRDLHDYRGVQADRDGSKTATLERQCRRRRRNPDGGAQRNWHCRSLPGVTDFIMFGTQAVGTSSTAQTITVTNNAPRLLPINSITRSGASAWAVHRDQNCLPSVGIEANLHDQRAIRTD